MLEEERGRRRMTPRSDRVSFTTRASTWPLECGGSLDGAVVVAAGGGTALARSWWSFALGALAHPARTSAAIAMAMKRDGVRGVMRILRRSRDRRELDRPRDVLLRRDADGLRERDEHLV